MDELNKVDVVIGGEIITLVSGENDDYLQQLARYIDKKLNEIKSMKTTASINERTRTLFIALNIADDFFRANMALKNLEADHERYVLELGRIQEENYLLNEKLHELQVKLIEMNTIDNIKAEGKRDTENLLNLNKPRATRSRQ